MVIESQKPHAMVVSCEEYDSSIQADGERTLVYEFTELSDNASDLLFSDHNELHARNMSLNHDTSDIITDNPADLFFCDSTDTRPRHSTLIASPEPSHGRRLDETLDISPIRTALWDTDPISGNSEANQVGPYSYADTIDEKWPKPTKHALTEAANHMSIYNVVKSSGLPNYLDAQIVIPSDIKPDAWEARLVGYHDVEIVQFLKYGWPGGYVSKTLPEPAVRNHPSALAYQKDVDRFVHKELDKGALLGPFDAPPFYEWSQVSPIMTRPKKDTDSRRIIIDLSYPIGRSVNDGVPKGVFQGRNFTFQLPTVRDLAARVISNGQGSYLWKADLERAYRQLRNDPLDYPLMGIAHRGRYYVDICPSFGARGSSSAQQRVSQAVCHIMRMEGHDVMAYVDDFCGAHRSFHDALRAFSMFEGLCEELGLRLAPDKSVFPTTKLEWLGIDVDTVQMRLTIPDSKLREIQALTADWNHKLRASKRELQSLAGKLNHVAQCITPAKKFMARILTTLRACPPHGTIATDAGLRADVRWFNQFAAASNGVCLLQEPSRIWKIQCDACLQGAGGFSDHNYYSLAFSPEIREEYHISQLEAANIVVALKSLLPSGARNIQVEITTDNTAAMYALNTGRTRDPILAACSRELWLVAATNQIRIVVNHAPGRTLVLADALSRRHHSPEHDTIAKGYIHQLKITEIEHIPLHDVLSNAL